MRRAGVAYNIVGGVYATKDGAGHTAGASTSGSTAFSLPETLTPGGNSNLATSISYASSWQVSSVSGPNGATGTTTYDAYGRPQKRSFREDRSEQPV